MRTCEVCGRPIRTGRKYCYEHRGTRSDNVVDKATKGYVNYHMNRTYVYVSILFIVLLIPFLGIGFILNQCWTVGIIGIVLSFILSLYISVKYLKVKFNPREDVRQKNPDYVNWVQTRVNKVKEEREFRKNLWR